MLATATILQKAQKVAATSKSVTQFQLIPLHDVDISGQDEAYFVAIKHRQGKNVSTFNLLPASAAELTQLALFLGTCSFFGKTVKHEIVPGQYIVSTPNKNGTVTVTFTTDSDLLETLADPSFSKKLVLNLNVDQLEAYEEFITSQLSPAVCHLQVHNQLKLVTTNFSLAS